MQVERNQNALALRSRHTPTMITKIRDRSTRRWSADSTAWKSALWVGYACQSVRINMRNLRAVLNGISIVSWQHAPTTVALPSKSAPELLHPWGPSTKSRTAHLISAPPDAVRFTMSKTSAVQIEPERSGLARRKLRSRSLVYGDEGVWIGVHEVSPEPKPQVATMTRVCAFAGRRSGHRGAIDACGGSPGGLGASEMGPRPQLPGSGSSLSLLHARLRAASKTSDNRIIGLRTR